MKPSTTGRRRKTRRKQATVISVARLLATTIHELSLPCGLTVRIAGLTTPTNAERFDMTVYNIKGKDGSTYEVDSGKISDGLCEYVFEQGLTKIINGRGFSKVGAKSSFPNADAFAKAAAEIVLKNIDDLYNDKTKRTGGTSKAKAKGEEAKLKAEMKRLARIDGDNMLKAAGHAISKVSTATKNEVADALIARDPEKYKKAALALINEAAKLAAETQGDLSAIGVTVHV